MWEDKGNNNYFLDRIELVFKICPVLRAENGGDVVNERTSSTFLWNSIVLALKDANYVFLAFTN